MVYGFTGWNEQAAQKKEVQPVLCSPCSRRALFVLEWHSATVWSVTGQDRDRDRDRLSGAGAGAGDTRPYKALQIKLLGVALSSAITEWPFIFTSNMGVLFLELSAWRDPLYEYNPILYAFCDLQNFSNNLNNFMESEMYRIVQSDHFLLRRKYCLNIAHARRLNILLSDDKTL